MQPWPNYTLIGPGGPCPLSRRQLRAQELAPLATADRCPKRGTWWSTRCACCPPDQTPVSVPPPDGAVPGGAPAVTAGAPRHMLPAAGSPPKSPPRGYSREGPLRRLPLESAPLQPSAIRRAMGLGVGSTALQQPPYQVPQYHVNAGVACLSDGVRRHTLPRLHGHFSGTPIVFEPDASDSPPAPPPLPLTGTAAAVSASPSARGRVASPPADRSKKNAHLDCPTALPCDSPTCPPVAGVGTLAGPLFERTPAGPVICANPDCRTQHQCCGRLPAQGVGVPFCDAGCQYFCRRAGQWARLRHLHRPHVPCYRLARVRFPRARLARMLNRGLAPGKTAMLRCCLARCPARALRQHHKRQLGHTWCRPRLVSSERAWAR